ncbi:SCO6880 family protein [Streptomyces sp. NRRL S-87]|uniref:SCO6880 family protein n=1 Tax=Streptomyces sp. NRRL S-87 TaxID=1463920 RepID=UPI000B177424|nr:SCO6880 family protein [Streptomyces sp. NRRL S-87]
MSAHEVPRGLMVGGFRIRRSFGVGGLSKGATMAAAGVLAADGLIGVQAPATLLVTLPVTAVGLGLAAARRHGMSALAYYWAKASWRRVARFEGTSYRRLLLPQPYALDLPGVGASSTLIQAHDPTSGRAVGVVHDRATGFMTISTLLAPGGSLMAQTGAVQSNLRTWSSLLEAMSTDEQIKGASVSIQITPGAGEALGDDVKARQSPDAPQLAKQVVGELLRTTPHATASRAAWMSVIVDPNAAANRPGDLAEQVGEALRVVDSLDLSGTGTDIERRLTDVDVRRLVRSAYDPDVFHARDAEFADLSWAECGPQAADDGWEEYAHDGGVSASWVLREMPRRPIPYSVLLPLLAPGRFQRRVTLAYRVLDPHEGEAVLEREISHAYQREQATAEVKGRAKWSQRADSRRAEEAAAQVAGGAQVVEWTLMVTVTARSAADLPAARQELERGVKATRGIRMRPAYGAQAAVFAAGLPLGYNPLVKD